MSTSGILVPLWAVIPAGVRPCCCLPIKTHTFVSPRTSTESSRRPGAGVMESFTRPPAKDPKLSGQSVAQRILRHLNYCFPNICKNAAYWSAWAWSLILSGLAEHILSCQLEGKQSLTSLSTYEMSSLTRKSWLKESWKSSTARPASFGYPASATDMCSFSLQLQPADKSCGLTYNKWRSCGLTYNKWRFLVWNIFLANHVHRKNSAKNNPECWGTFSNCVELPSGILHSGITTAISMGNVLGGAKRRGLTSREKALLNKFNSVSGPFPQLRRLS